MISYARIYILASIFMAGLLLGWTYEHRALVAYKEEVKRVAEVQIAKNESIAKQQALISKGISDAYEAKLTALRGRFDGLHNTSSNSMPSVSDTTIRTYVASPNFALDCAVTTQQLVSLQDWLNQQIGVK